MLCIHELNDYECFTCKHPRKAPLKVYGPSFYADNEMDCPECDLPIYEGDLTVRVTEEYTSYCVHAGCT